MGLLPFGAEGVGRGDSGLVGGSKEQQLVSSNVEAIAKGPLPAGLASELDKIWDVLEEGNA